MVPSVDPPSTTMIWLHQERSIWGMMAFTPSISLRVRASRVTFKGAFRIRRSIYAECQQGQLSFGDIGDSLLSLVFRQASDFSPRGFYNIFRDNGHVAHIIPQRRRTQIQVTARDRRWSIKGSIRFGRGDQFKFESGRAEIENQTPIRKLGVLQL